MFLPKRIGGTEVATYNIASYLAKRGHEVHVITTLDEGLPKESKEGEFYIHRIFRREIKFLGIISLWIKMFWCLRKVKPDIIHSQSTVLGMPCLFAKIFLRIPYIVYGRGSDVYLPWTFKQQISALILKNANSVIALTEDMKGKMQSICLKEILVIPNGLNLKNFKNILKGVARKKLNIKREDRVIIFTGTLHSVKGVNYLIQGMDIIKQKGIKAKLLLVGDGEDREALMRLTEELELEQDITFAGRVSNEKVPEYMFASDVFVLPSLSESFGIVILEAMASQLPIIATNVGGLPEIVKEGVNGFLVPPKNPDELAKKIILILQNDELRHNMSKNNAELAKDYEWDVIVEKIEQVYLSILS